jgi:hypothetical protein
MNCHEPERDIPPPPTHLTGEISSVGHYSLVHRMFSGWWEKKDEREKGYTLQRLADSKCSSSGLCSQKVGQSKVFGRARLSKTHDWQFQSSESALMRSLVMGSTPYNQCSPPLPSKATAQSMSWHTAPMNTCIHELAVEGFSCESLPVNTQWDKYRLDFNLHDQFNNVKKVSIKVMQVDGPFTIVCCSGSSCLEKVLEFCQAG